MNQRVNESERNGTPPPTHHRRPHAQLVLQRLESLPTLRAVAVRILEVTSREDAEAGEVIRLISSDPALASRVLKLCRCSQRSRHAEVRTVERAVLMMGFDAVRTAVLSVEIFDTLSRCTPAEATRRTDPPSLFEPAASPRFDLCLHWHHSLATATLAEAIVRGAPHQLPITPGEALLLGLLHDLGAIALKIVLPDETDVALRLAQERGVGFDAACRAVIGLDTHTAGKRLAEHWDLPEIFRDVMWLHGQPIEAVPSGPMRDPIILIGLADQLARRCYLAPTDQGRTPLDENACLRHLQIAPPQVERLIEMLPDEVRQRAAALGLDHEPDDQALLAAVRRANTQLGRLSQRLQKEALAGLHRDRAIKAMQDFQKQMDSRSGPEHIVPAIVRSLAQLTGGGTFLVIDRPPGEDAHRIVRYDAEGRMLDARTVDDDEEAPPREALRGDPSGAQAARRLGPALRDLLDDELPARQLRVLPLLAERGDMLLLLHDAPDGREIDEELMATCRMTWRSALVAARQQDAVRQLSERLAERNRALIDAQEGLTRARAMASVGEMAAGAAHEMNNPLTVIAGRAQLLAREMAQEPHRTWAGQIVDASKRLSAMITALERFAHPAPPKKSACSIRSLLAQAVEEVRSSTTNPPAISLQVDADAALAEAELDASQMHLALVELVRNAAEANGCSRIELCVQIDPHDDRLTVAVQDDGCGLTPEAHRHAFDPFFSAKPAGRRPGLGLARAQRIVEAHGGTLTLENADGSGARAVIHLPDWRRCDSPSRAVA